MSLKGKNHLKVVRTRTMVQSQSRAGTTRKELRHKIKDGAKKEAMWAPMWQ